MIPLVVACDEEGDCPALECGDTWVCARALLSCPEGRRCPVPAATVLQLHDIVS